ncbi:hypothetical protein BZY95_05095 [Billgrantia desiderata SP1]|uniref:heparinase II/III domain-containing protein n=1 Tax=Billgrantia desiderata TaxID=52021 RepID=UPI000A3D0219|nr:heparinase II/III family protein [Halomonas desiderata]OUE44882.1 hypothetical protein BZY95_05095 [Halomonas desiderata SP1]
MLNLPCSDKIEAVKKFEEVGFVPVKRPDLDPFVINLPFDWSIDPYNDENWKFQLHTLRYLMVYLEAYICTGSEKYADRLIEYILDWHEFVTKRSCDYAWHDMATGIRSEKLYLIYSRLTNDGYTKTDLLKPVVNKHLSVLKKTGFFNPSHNHGMYVLHGLRCLAEVIEFEEYESIKEYCEKSWRTLIDNQLDANFVHKEHSPHYHFLFIDSLKRYVNSGLYEDFSYLKETLIRAEQNSEMFLLPDGREVPFGDTDNAECIGIEKRAGKIEKDELVLYSKSGYVLCKGRAKNSSFLAFTNTYHSKIHKHWDNLSLIWGERGQDILVDPGKYKYASDVIRKKVISSGAHNTINFVEEEWSGGNLVPPCEEVEVLKTGDGIALLSSIRIKRKKKEFKFERRVNYSPGKLVVFDKVSPESGEKVCSRFNLHKSARLISFREGIFVFDCMGVLVKIEAFAFLQGKRKTVMPIIEQVPVSYKYGSYENCVSLVVCFVNSVEVSFEITE